MKIKSLLLIPVLLGVQLSVLYGQTTFGNLSIDPLNPGEYRFKLQGLPTLDGIEPAEVHSDPQYQVFVETGDGYYFRKMMEPYTSELSFNYGYIFRDPKPEDVNTYMTPLYSPNKRPGIPDNVSISEPLEHSPGAAGNSQKYDFIDQGNSAFADLKSKLCCILVLLLLRLLIVCCLIFVSLIFLRTFFDNFLGGDSYPVSTDPRF